MSANNMLLPTAICLIAAGAWAVDYDPNDFASEVVEYVQGAGVGTDWLNGDRFNNPLSAIGAPASRTSGDSWYIPPDATVPVVPVYPAFRASELVTIGNGGHLILRFSHPVANDRNNPYGMDFIIYGDAHQLIGGGQGWTNGNPQLTIVSNLTHAEQGIVSVSQDGVEWYYFQYGPFADTFAPTAGYRWDSEHSEWGEPLDPTRPIPPGLEVSGMTVAEMIDAYDGSAGGTAFDIAEVGLDWILYVKIEDNPNSAATTEIDAIADVSACGDYRHPVPAGDVTGDCRVDMADLALTAENWLTCTWDCN